MFLVNVSVTTPPAEIYEIVTLGAIGVKSDFVFAFYLAFIN